MRLLTPAMLVAHLVMVVATAACVALGGWQYNAWQTARTQAQEDTSLRTPIPLAEALGADDPFPQAMIGQPVKLSGTWVEGSTFFVANRNNVADPQTGGERGEWVVTALAIDSALTTGSDGPESGAESGPESGPENNTASSKPDSALLIVRGFRPAPSNVPTPPKADQPQTDRNPATPDPTTAIKEGTEGTEGKEGTEGTEGTATTEGTEIREPTGRAEFIGWLEPPEGDPDLIDDDPNDRVIPQLRMADAVQLVPQDLYGGFAFVADRGGEDFKPGLNPGTDGLEPISVDMLADPARFTAVRNILYAYEWWFFAAFVVFLWQRWVRDELAKTS